MALTPSVTEFTAGTLANACPVRIVYFTVCPCLCRCQAVFSWFYASLKSRTKAYAAASLRTVTSHSFSWGRGTLCIHGKVTCQTESAVPCVSSECSQGLPGQRELKQPLCGDTSRAGRSAYKWLRLGECHGGRRVCSMEGVLQQTCRLHPTACACVLA